MQDFLKEAAGQFGISEEGAGNAVGGVLGMLKDNSDKSDFNGLLDKVPGAGDLLKKAGGGGGGGGLLGSIGGMLGGKAGGALGMASILEKSGLSMDNAGGFVGKLVGYFKEKAGAGLIEKLMGNVPDLGKLLGK